MPTYTIQTPSGKTLKIQADDEGAAMAGAQQYHDDESAMVQTVHAEEQNPDAQRAIASVIANRAASSGRTPRDVVTEGNGAQFEPWKNPAAVQSLQPDSPEYQKTLANIAPVLTNGPQVPYTHFYAPGAQAALGRAAPKWDDGSGQTIGSSRFFTNDKEYPVPAAGAAAQPATAPAQAPPAADQGVYDPTTNQPYNDAQAKTFRGLQAAGQIDMSGPVPTYKGRPIQAATDAAAPTTPGTWFVDVQGGLRQVPVTPSMGQDAESGFKQPFIDLGHGIMQDYRRKQAQFDGPLPTLAQAAQTTGQDIAGAARQVGDVLGLTSAPIQAAVRPIARAINRSGLTPYQAPQLSLQGGLPQLSAPRPLYGDDAQNTVEGSINTALSAAMPKSAAVRAPIAKPMALDELKAAKTAAYTAADQAGVQFHQPAAQQLAGDIGAMVESEGGPELYPKAAAMAKRIDSVVAKGNISLTTLDKLRSQVAETVMKGSDAEARIGGMMRSQIDDFIDTAGPHNVSAGNGADASALISNARDLNTRYRKVQEVTDRADSADLRAGSTYSGGNVDNATRQNLRPLIDPKSPQRIRNLTPDETKALNTAVRGSSAQNGVRLAGKLLDPRGLLGATVQTMMGIPTGGHSLPSAALGMAATEAGKGMTARNVQRLVDLMSTGGSRPTSALPPYVATPTKLLSLPGVIGAGEVAAPLARLSADPSTLPRKRKQAARQGR